MQQNSARRASIILGVFMVIVLVGGAILPLFTQNQTLTTPPIEPTAIPTATFPPPVTNFDSISFDELYLHPSGLYTIALPTGFAVTQPDTNASYAQINLNNSETLGVIDAYMEKPFNPITTEELSDHFNEAALDPTWGRYNNWQETGRRMEGDKLVMDFSITFQNRPYAARQASWTDGERIYSVRVLAPANAINYIRYLLDNLVNTITPLNLFENTPFEWQITYDNITNAIIRHPADWIQTDGGVGRPTTLTSANGAVLRIASQAGATVADEAAARAWIESVQPGASVFTVQPVTRGAASGFNVSYSYQTFDGDAMSGLAVLLNATDAEGENPTLLSANLRFPGSAVDLTTVDPTIMDSFSVPPSASAVESPLIPAEDPMFATQTTDPRLPTLAAVMNTFQTIAPLNLAASTLPATPTPLPTVTPTSIPVTPTAEPETTAEATAETDLEATVSEMDADATPEVTAEATSES